MKEPRGKNRREFMAIAGATGASLIVAGIPGGARGEDQAPPKVLIAYATKYRTTRDVADAAAQELGAQGATCEVKLVKDVIDISSYAAVIVGGPARNLAWFSEAEKFVADHQAALGNKSVAFFVTCLQIVPGQPQLARGGRPPKDETLEQKKERVRTYLDDVRKKNPQVVPLEIGVFPGALKFDDLSPTDRSIMKSMGFKEGDFRDLNEVKAWARALGPRLIKRG